VCVWGFVVRKRSTCDSHNGFCFNNKTYHCEQTHTLIGLSSGVRHCISTLSGTDRHILTPPGLQLGSLQVNQPSPFFDSFPSLSSQQVSKMPDTLKDLKLKDTKKLRILVLNELKWDSLPKNVHSVIIFSPSCRSKLVNLISSVEHKRMYFEILCFTFCPYKDKSLGSNVVWTPVFLCVLEKKEQQVWKNYP